MYPIVRRSRVSSSRSIQAPTGGLDTSESLASMPENRAIKMLNWFPDTDRVVLRAGSTTRISDIGDRVETLMTYGANDGSQELFAAAGDSIYDITPPASTSTAVVTGMTSAKWEWVNFGTLGGQFLIAVNGIDEPRLYDGSTWGVTAITGVTESTLCWVTPHQRRLWFGQVDSLTVYYLDVDSVGGAASPFYLGGVARKGGFVQAMGTWTRDSGAGPDDVAVFITSEGEVLIYQGTDPSSITTWSLVGIFDIGRPIGKRCLVKYGGDLLIITEFGVVPLTQATTTDQSQQGLVAYSKRINKTLNDYIRLYGSFFGWQQIIYPRGRMLIVNVPISLTKSEQFVFNTITGAACQFTGMNALAWGMHKENIFFGTADGKIIEADTGVTDDGAPIDGDVIQAFSYFGSAGTEKAFKRVAPIFTSAANPSASVQAYTNFNLARFTATPQQPISSDSLWGIAKWGIDKWGSKGRVWYNWIPIEGVGRSATVRVRIRVTHGRPAWTATNWTFIQGGNL